MICFHQLYILLSNLCLKAVTAMCHIITCTGLDASLQSHIDIIGRCLSVFKLWWSQNQRAHVIYRNKHRNNIETNSLPCCVLARFKMTPPSQEAVAFLQIIAVMLFRLLHRTQHFKQSIRFMHESRLKDEGCLVHWWEWDHVSLACAAQIITHLQIEKLFLIWTSYNSGVAQYTLHEVCAVLKSFSGASYFWWIEGPLTKNKSRGTRSYF